MREEEYRVFYNICGAEVNILRILPKAVVQEYLKEMGYDSENG